LTNEPVAEFLVGAREVQELMIIGAGNVDAAAWVRDDEVLVSIVNLDYNNKNSNITVALPEGVKVTGVSRSLWGDACWSVHDNKLSIDSLMGLEVSLLLLKRT